MRPTSSHTLSRTSSSNETWSQSASRRSRTFFSGGLALATNYDRPTRVQVSVSRKVAPAFFGTGGAIISNVAALSVTQRFSKVLRLTASGYYAKGESAPVNVYAYESFQASAVLEYKVTRSVNLSLSQEYNKWTYTGVAPFDRYATMLNLSVQWK
jgi:hypothetical protein